MHPWHFYLGILAWSSSGGLRWTEALVLVLAAVGAAMAWVRRDPALDPDAAFWPRYLTANAALSMAIFSAIPYKTPWNLLPFYAATIVAAGIGVSALARATASRAVHVLMAGVLAIAAGHLGWQAWRASVVYAADPRNPYVYSQTVPDAVRMAARIRDLAALHPDRDGMLVMVVAPPHEQWPLPWYLRAMPHVGYWATASEVPDLTAPVIVASMGNAETLDAALGDRYVSEFFGVRPEVLVTLYVERGALGSLPGPGAGLWAEPERNQEVPPARQSSYDACAGIPQQLVKEIARWPTRRRPPMFHAGNSSAPWPQPPRV